MTRAEALLKLIAVEPVTKEQLILSTGWSLEETRKTLADLHARGEIGFKLGSCGVESTGHYFAKVSPW